MNLGPIRFIPRLFTLLAFPVLVFGQKNPNKETIHKGQNEINVSFTPQYYFNKLNVHNDGVLPGLISAKNMPGFNFSLDYHRITHYGLVYGAGVSFGQIGHDVTVWYKDWGFFYPGDINRAKQVGLKGSTYYHYRGNTNFLSFHPSIGYRFNMPGRFMKGWDCQIDFNYNFLLYLNGSSQGLFLLTDFQNKTGDTIFRSAPFLEYHTEFGKGKYISFWQQQLSVMYGANLTLSKEMNWRWLSNVSIGLKVTYSGNGRNSPDGSYYHSQTSGSGWAYAKAYNDRSVYTKNAYSAPGSTNEYRARDFSIGLKLGVGLWPNAGKQKGR